MYRPITDEGSNIQLVLYQLVIDLDEYSGVDVDLFRRFCLSHKIFYIENG
jgi:hypothetical protein